MEAAVCRDPPAGHRVPLYAAVQLAVPLWKTTGSRLMSGKVMASTFKEKAGIDPLRRSARFYHGVMHRFLMKHTIIHEMDAS